MGSAVKQLRGKDKRRANGGSKPPQQTSPIDKARGHELVWDQVGYFFESVRGAQDCSFIYFIGEADAGPIKIGVAKDPIARLRGMQTGNPRRLKVEWILIGDGHAEKLLHEFWEPFAIRSAAKANKVGAAPGTEWFKPEIREKLYPIVETAQAEQAALVHEHDRDRGLTFDAMEQIIRDAHKHHDFVAQGRDNPRLLGAQGGYVMLGRQSRI